MRARLIAIGTAGLLAALSGAPCLAATLYKWVDEKGVVHYTDKMPADAVDKSSVELNKQGIPIKRVDAAPTPEQRRAKQLDEERQKQAAREREVVDRRDRALMESYISADEIDLARSRAVGTLEAQLRSAQVFSMSLGKRRQELEAKRQSYGDKAVPPAMERELEGIGVELAKQDALIAERKREIAVANARYDADKQRWQELRAIALARQGAAAAANPAGNAAGNPAAPGPAAPATGKVSGR
jgi:hypothetical protein